MPPKKERPFIADELEPDPPHRPLFEARAHLPCSIVNGKLVWASTIAGYEREWYREQRAKY